MEPDNDWDWNDDIPVNADGEVSDIPDTYDDLLRRKWELQEQLADLRRAMLDRDARAVDELCALKTGDTA
jgi:hypothetical protein